MTGDGRISRPGTGAGHAPRAMGLDRAGRWIALAVAVPVLLGGLATFVVAGSRMRVVFWAFDVRLRQVPVLVAAVAFAIAAEAVAEAFGARAERAAGWLSLLLVVVGTAALTVPVWVGAALLLATLAAPVAPRRALAAAVVAGTIGWGALLLGLHLGA